MCDYCDCRRIPEIADLGAEHELIEELGDEALRLAKAGSPDFPAALERLRAALDPHVMREERGVFTQARIAGLGGTTWTIWKTTIDGSRRSSMSTRSTSTRSNASST